MISRKIGSHMGLIELCNLSSSVNTFLGPCKLYKFIYDQDTHESTLTCSSFRLLESLNLTSPTGQLLNETIQAHHKAYKTGTTTLFFLVGAWSSAVLECLQQGVPSSLIVSIMLEGLSSCIENLASLHIHLNNILLTNQSSIDKTPDRHESTSKKVDTGASRLKHLHYKSSMFTEVESSSRSTEQRSRPFHSRHFSIQHRSCSQNIMPINNLFLDDLTKPLSHGCPEAMKLVENAVTYLSENVRDNFVTKDLFDASRLDICVLEGHLDVASNASFGFTTLVTSENAAITKELEGKPLKVLLLDGDLTEKYRHLGFNNATNLKSVAEFLNSKTSTSEDTWITSACRKIIQAGADLILVRGNVCPLLLMHCSQRNILIISNVKINVLQAFSECTGAEPVIYHTQINQHSIGCGVFVSICRQGNSVLQSVNQRVAINLKAYKMNLTTVVLCCRLMPKMQILEDQFWTCSYRLHHALHDQKVFPGGGAVELLCLNHLRKLVSNIEPFSSDKEEQHFHKSSWTCTAAVHYKACVFNCLAKGWYKYMSVLLCNMNAYSSELESMAFIQNEIQNMTNSTSPSSYILNEYVKTICLVGNADIPIEHRPIMVYDNVVPKVEAWRSALHLVLTVLQSDAEIITGATAQMQIMKTESTHEDYIFL